MNGAIGGGAVAVIVSSNASQQAEETRKRRLKNMGHDQDYIKVKDSIDSVGKKIASLYSNWVYKDKAIYDKKSKFSIGTFFGALFICGIIIVVLAVAIVSIFIDGYSQFEDANNFFKGIFHMSMVLVLLILDVVISIVFGFAGGGDIEVEHIKIEDFGSYTSVLIKKYGSEGSRNYDENEIDKIYHVLGLEYQDGDIRK